MTISISTNGDNRILTLQYEALQTKVDPLLEAAAKWFYHHKGQSQVEGKTFEDLSNQEKLQIINNAVKNYLLHSAKQCNLNDDIQTARIAAEAENKNTYDLGAE